ncbi:NAD(P)/FAD-dependent oxidoreductase [Aspergillus novofumigatus IBT 16806]|uniref:FAD/NAD(P)-binding domain-containing protein n=1 Tax=Aspergillus novofumigatus (strain IBT 16806) TaxID=1392255 RepID=A0A2I1CHA8_ASPN1|nr:FAD/NAD(P)-binding domain-containing protein [Aspergillus novofumigatus IBT 16806]PKX97016.1 FAD/NAD(P)-binding domain-containing protein [Aspergillus novofumigatus IBT 16806]
MSLQKIKLFLQFYYLSAKHNVQQGLDRVSSYIHRINYRPHPSPRQVLVLGGSFAGSHVAQRLAHTLPSGWMVTLLEKNSHFHYAFAFPRLAVLGGRESQAFIPYDRLAGSAPPGIFQHVQGEAKTVNLDENHVTLTDGNIVPYDYLVIATGAAQPAPTRLRSVSREQATAELRECQRQIRDAERIAVIGGGAAGIELVTEIKEEYGRKHVTLIHSRDQLLPRFGPKIHEYVMADLQKRGVEILLRERPEIPRSALGEAQGPMVLTMADGSKRHFDLVIQCTGLRPNSKFMLPHAANSLAANGEIIVKPTLQVGIQESSSSRSGQDLLHHGRIFALGDVARTGGPKQGRACMLQGDITVKNILAMIRGSPTLKEYNPHPFEGALQLTMGKKHQVMYLQMPGYEFLQPMQQSDEDLGAARMWKKLNAKYVE